MFYEIYDFQLLDLSTITNDLETVFAGSTSAVIWFIDLVYAVAHTFGVPRANLFPTIAYLPIVNIANIILFRFVFTIWKVETT